VAWSRNERFRKITQTRSGVADTRSPFKERFEVVGQAEAAG